MLVRLLAVVAEGGADPPAGLPLAFLRSVLPVVTLILERGEVGQGVPLGPREPLDDLRREAIVGYAIWNALSIPANQGTGIRGNGVAHVVPKHVQVVAFDQLTPVGVDVSGVFRV